MIFLSQETPKLFWEFCLHVQLINFIISHKQYLLRSYFFWQVLTRKLYQYVRTLWVQHHESLFKALQQNIKFDYQYPLVVQIFFSMEDCAPSTFLMNWALVAPYLCSRFRSFDNLVLEEYVFQVEGGPHLLQSYLRAAQDGLLPATREMLSSFKNLVVISALGLHASLMDIHHDTSLKSILKEDSISSASKVHICFCSSKGARLWFITRPYIYSFCIAHSTFTLVLHFCLGLI